MAITDIVPAADHEGSEGRLLDSHGDGLGVGGAVRLVQRVGELQDQRVLAL